MKHPTVKPKKITQDMVGMKIYTCMGSRTEEEDEATVYIVLHEVSDEGLEIFGIDQDNEMDWTHKNNLQNPVVRKKR